MPELGPVARQHISDPESHIIISAATVWEIEIKRALGNLDAPEDIRSAIDAARFDTLPMTVDHSITAARLPLTSP